MQRTSAPTDSRVSRTYTRLPVPVQLHLLRCGWHLGSIFMYSKKLICTRLLDAIEVLL